MWTSTYHHVLCPEVRIYRSSFAKCTALWNKSRSTVAADVIQEKLKRKLLIPSPTRWNSYYDAVNRVIENSPRDLNDVCTSIETRNFTEKELTFLKEYCSACNHYLEGWISFRVKILVIMAPCCPP